MAPRKCEPEVFHYSGSKAQEARHHVMTAEWQRRIRKEANKIDKKLKKKIVKKKENKERKKREQKGKIQAEK